MEIAENIEEGLLNLANNVNTSNIVIGNDSNPFGDDDYTDDWGPSEEIKKKASFDTSSCKQILFEGITSTSTVRAWDILILIPNLCFLAFLFFRLKRAREKLTSVNTPTLTILYSLVWICCLGSISRCFMSMIIAMITQKQIEEKEDKLLWLILRMLLFATEVCVMVFALLSGHLAEAKSSVKRTVIASVIGSLAFTLLQTILEMKTLQSNSTEHYAFYYKTANMDRPLHLFSYGGVLFWMISSVIFAVFYAIVMALPVLPCRRWLAPPNQKSFYHYMFFMLLLNIIQAVGCAMIYAHESPGKSTGMCFLNLATFFYVVAFIPIMYFSFLSQFLSSKSIQPTLLFSYKAQVNDGDFEELGMKLGDPNESPFSLSTAALEDACDDLSLEQNRPIIISFQDKPPS